MLNSDATSAQQTQFFFELTPDRILNEFERATGLRSTGRVLQLNSLENRVFEVEVEMSEEEEAAAQKNPAARFRIAKFYRPGRWTKEQILEEHQFAIDLSENDIPAVAPVVLTNGTTIMRCNDSDILFCVFPKVQGRAPEELDEEGFRRIGRLLARMHGVGAQRPLKHRLRLDPATYGVAMLRAMVDRNVIPESVRSSYVQVVEGICSAAEPLFSGLAAQRIHGDCHYGNLLLGREGFFLVDFDDMITGPCVQDLWLLVPGRDDYAARCLEHMLEAYETMRRFDRQTLRLVEPLRALRYIMFSGWVAQRFEDPAFKKAFAHFATERYWQEQLQDLREQYSLMVEQI